MIIRKPKEIEKDIENLQKELKKSQKHYKIKPKKQDEGLRIPDSVRWSDNGAFKGKTYYESYMEKLVWEEDD